VVIIYVQPPSDNSLWEYAVRRGWEPLVVSDADVLMKLVRASRVEIVLASSLNGLGRSVLGLVQVLREFVAHKVALIIPSAGIDTSKMSGKVFLDTLDAISEFKHSVAVERTNAGLNAARRRGVKLGRPTT
jgi:DNA invertase Pin-like site-specific DNA recombinase